MKRINRGTEAQRHGNIEAQRHRGTGAWSVFKLCAFFTLFLCHFVFADSGRVLDVNDNPYYITTIYDGNDLRDIQYAQINDVMYLVHPEYPPQKLTRFDHASWTIEDVNWEDGPFLEGNTDTTKTITPDGTTGDVNLVTTNALFDSNHVGALWQISHWLGVYHKDGGWSSEGEKYTDATDEYLQQYRYMDVTTGGIWEGSFYIQNSYDGGVTWNNIFSHRVTYGGNIQFTYQELNDDCLIRLYISNLSIEYSSDELGYMTYSISFRSFLNNGVVEITDVNDPNNAAGSVKRHLGSTAETWRWAEGAWSDYRGWPRAICFYQNRLCLAGSLYCPNMLWCSQSSDYENMYLGTGLDNEAIAREIGSAGQNPIMWIKDKKGIIAGTTGAIIKIGTPDGKYVFTPSTITSERSVETGTCSIQPGLTNSSIVYVDRNRRKVRDLSYDVSVDDMVSPDITIFSDDITSSGILEMAWQKRPDEIGWFVLNDGNMVTLSYNPAQGVAAWTELATDGNYVSVCVIPGTDEDEVWTAVERDCNDYIMVEKFHSQNWKDDVWFVDSGLEYSGAATNTLTGMGHLEGKEVQVYSDANGYLGDFTVSDSNIVLDVNVTQAIAGLGYTATIKTFPIEVSTQLGPSIGMTKNIRLITLCLYESEGGRYGYEKMYDILYPSYSTDFYTGLTRLGMDTGYQLETYLIIDQNEPLPLGITGIAINKYELSDDF